MEAAFLFSFDIGRIQAVIHRQSIIHGMVCFKDRSIKALLSKPDMIIPVEYALNCGKRTCDDIIEDDNCFESMSLSFGEDFKDWQKRSINFAYSAYKEKKCIAFNSANEKAVSDFLKKRIKFTDIQDSIEKILTEAEPETINSVDDIMQLVML
jgi:1-deoxy-D-xylulose-5-phosphate reductoisomerase